MKRMMSKRRSSDSSRMLSMITQLQRKTRMALQIRTMESRKVEQLLGSSTLALLSPMKIPRRGSSETQISGIMGITMKQRGSRWIWIWLMTRTRGSMCRWTSTQGRVQLAEEASSGLWTQQMMRKDLNNLDYQVEGTFCLKQGRLRVDLLQSREDLLRA